MDLKEAYRSLDPARPLEPDSTFYVARPGNPVSSIITELRLTDMPRRYLLTGHRGAGKTTELHRIAHELSDEYEIETISAEGDLVSVIRRIEQANPGRTLYLIDGVDKFDFHESDLSLNQFGYLIDALHQQQISAICTIPLAFALSGTFGSILQTIDQLCFLPSINIRAQNGESIPQNWRRCRKIIERRANIFSDAALEILIENSGGIHREILRLAQRACVFAATEDIDEFDDDVEIQVQQANRAVQHARNEYSLRLRSEDIWLLERVYQTGQISGDPNLLRLVRDQLIVAYGGANTWFAVHPIVLPMISGLEAPYR